MSENNEFSSDQVNFHDLANRLQVISAACRVLRRNGSSELLVSQIEAELQAIEDMVIKPFKGST